MDGPTRTALLRTILALAAAGSCHIARPLAVSAQVSAAARIEVTVLPGTAPWIAHDLAHRFAARPEAGPSGPSRHEEGSLVVWTEERAAPTPTRVVTVAHLGH